MTRAQCGACPWRDVAMMRAEFPELVEYARENPTGFVCHTRCGPCPGPTRALAVIGVTEVNP